jgi:hypothetical protein
VLLGRDESDEIQYGKEWEDIKARVHWRLIMGIY